MILKHQPEPRIRPSALLQPNADAVVLGSMPLREDIDRGNLSRFGDDIWEMAPAVFNTRLCGSTLALDFTVISCPTERLLAKEYIFARLNVRLGSKRLQLNPASARDTLSKLRKFTEFIRNRHGQLDLSLVDQRSIDAYLVYLKSTLSAGDSVISKYLKSVLDLWLLKSYLSRGGLTFLPWGGRPLSLVAGCRQRRHENATPRIPEPVIGKLLHWSLKYVDLFSQDIFAARTELVELERNHSQRSLRRKNDVVERVDAWIEARRKAGRGIPVWNDPDQMSGRAHKLSRLNGLRGEVINLKLITLQTGLNAQTIQENKYALSIIHEAAGELGLEKGGMDTPISIDPDSGLPWRTRFDPYNLLLEEKNLQTAAFILCAYLTGMRTGEIQAMRTGALRCSRTTDGLVERLALRSRVHKGRDARGEEAEWITIAPVDRAIAAVETLADYHRRQENGDDLWFILGRASKVPSRGIPNIVRGINRLRATIDQRYGTIEEPVFPPVEGQAWNFSIRQFRRTLAWYIANRPFGVVAGKIQYKHASVAMFDGYAGSSVSGFRREVEQERALGQLEDIVEHYENHLAAKPKTGPAASRLSAEFDHVRQELNAFPGRIADNSRVRAMLSHLARNLHVGHLTDCFFNPATALCIAKDNDVRKTPAFSRCAPDRCPNSCLTQRHLPVWEAQIAENESLLKTKRLSQLQREALKNDGERMRKLIAPLKDARNQ